MDESKTILGGGEDSVVNEPTVTPADNAAVTGGGDEGSFDWSGMIDSQGFFSDNWKNGLPEDLRNEPCLDNVKNFTTLTKSFVNAQKMIGKNKIAIPGENATDEERNAFYSALGRPASASEYKNDNVKIPDGIVFDDGAMKAFKEFAFQSGLSQATYEKALAFDVQRVQNAMKAAVEAHNKEYDETMGKLQEQYGGNLPARIAQVDKALTTFGIKDLFIERGLTNNYQIFEALAKIGESISESKLKAGDVPQSVKSPQQQIDEIYADPQGAIYNIDHPGHDKAVAEVKRLMALVK